MAAEIDKTTGTPITPNSPAVEVPDDYRDVSQAMKFASTPPEEAAQNIDRSNLYSVKPDAYKELREVLDPQVEAMEQPATVERGVATYMKQSTQHASLVKEDVESLNYLERQIKFISNQVFDIPSNEEEIAELRIKEMDSGADLDQSDIETLRLLNKNRQRLNEQNYGIEGIAEQLPGQVLGVIGDMYRSIVDNSGIVAGLTAAGAGAGALTGLGIPVPGTSAIGAGAGAVAGFATGIGVAGFVRGYQMIRGSMYNDLSYMTDDQGKELNLDRDEKKYIAHGVASIGGAASFFVGNRLARNNPFLKGITSPKVAKQLLNNPALRTALTKLGYVSSSILDGGGGEAVEEFAAVIGEEIAKSDGSEASIINALNNVTSVETLTRLGHSALIGGIATGSIAGGSNVLHAGVQKITKRPKFNPLKDRKQGAVDKSKKVLNAQDAFINIAKVSDSTKFKKLSPGEMSNFKKQAFELAGYKDNIWLHPEDLHDFATTPEKIKLVNDMIESSGTLNSQIGAPIGIEPHKFSDIVEIFPDISDHMRVNPEGPNPLEARNYVERLTESKVKSQKILADLGVEGKMTPEIEAQLEEALLPTHGAKEIFNENEFYDKPTFDSQETDLFTDKEISKYNKDLTDARFAAAESLKSDVNTEFQTVENRVTKFFSEQEVQAEIKSLDRELKILDQFDKKNVNPVAMEFKKSHKKKGYSPYAIDPSSLPEDLRAIYIDDPNLNKRKIFVEGGLTLDESASLTGLKNGADLLKVLAETPERSEIIKNREQREIDIRNRTQQSLKVDKELAMNKAFTNVTKAHLREANFMVKKKWSTTKGLIKKIALKVPKSEELNFKATTIVKKTPIGKLNHNQFLVGERKNQRSAVNHILKLEVEQAVKAKENAAFNTELAKETLTAKAKVKSAEKFLKRLKKPELQQEIKDAGYTAAVDEILDVYNLDLNKRGLSKQGSYDAFVKEQVDLGNAVFEIPEKFNDVRENANDLSVEQYLAITDRIKTIAHQAKMKNKLYKKFREKQLLQTEEAIVSQAAKNLEQHPDFDSKKAEAAPSSSLSIWEKTKGLLNTAQTLVTNAENIATYMDGDKLGGYMHELFIQPMKGDKNIYGERSGWLGKQEDISDFVGFLKKNADAYGKKKFTAIQNDVRFIPEFEGYSSLGNGHIRKGELLMMLAYMGDPDGVKRLSNFVNKNGESLDASKIMRILDRELDSSDAALVQNLLLNSFKSYGERSSKLHKETTGQDARMIKGIPFTHKGKVYPGGYFPNKYQFTSDDVKINKLIKDTSNKVSTLFGGDDSQMYSQLKAAEMTEQGRYEERTGSTRPLDLNFNNFVGSIEEMLHDLNFRKVGIDNLKLLKNPIMAKNIKSVAGDKGYKLMLNSTIEVVGEMESRNRNYFGEQQQFIDNMFNSFDKGFALSTLAMNLSSIAIQPVSIVNAALRMGPTGTKYLTKAAGKLGSNLGMYNEFRASAEEINPSIRFAKDAIDDSLVQSSFKMIPSTQTFFKKYKKSASVLSTLRRGQDSALNFLMSGLSEADGQIKIVTTLAAYDQFTSGDVEGYPMSRLQKMSDAEIHKAASNYTRQLTRLSLTSSAIDDKAPIQKMVASRFFVKFWNDLRSQLNTQMAQGRKIRWNAKDMKSALDSGDYGAAQKAGVQSAGALTSMIIAASVTKLYSDVIRGEDTPLDELTEIKDMKSFEEFGKQTVAYMGTAVPQTVIESTPFARDVMNAYMFGGRRDYRNVKLPVMKVFSDFTTGVSGLADMLSMAVGGDGNVSDVELKAMLFSASYLVGGLPINGLYKFKKSYETGFIGDGVEYVTVESKRLNKAIDSYIEKFGNKPEAKDFIEELKQVQKEILPHFDRDVEKVIPEDAQETIKQVSSGGDWDVYDPDTGAAGVYQFTEERWNEIQQSNPALGLTENGRVAKDSKQQEQAMNWSIQDNTRGLIAYGIPVDNETLYGAHKFGFDNFVKIYNAKGNEKLTEVLGNEISNDPLYNNFKTVKSAKDFISKEMKSVDK